MNLFLAQAVVKTTHSPGDDGMSEGPDEDVTRIIEAEDVVEAEKKFRAAYEKDEPYRIRVSLENVRISGVIR